MVNQNNVEEHQGEGSDVSELLRTFSVESETNHEEANQNPSTSNNVIELPQRVETPDSEVFIDEEMPRPRRIQPVAPPIQVYRQWVDPFGGGHAPRASTNDPLGPYTIPRITRPTPPGTFPDLRYYDFPNGNEGIENVPPSYRTPDWHAWAGWLGPRASFRVRWGSPYPIRKQYADTPPPPRRRMPVIRPPQKSFRVDWICPIPYGSDRIFSRTCRIAVLPTYAPESCYTGDGLSIFQSTSWSPVDLPSLPRAPVASDEPFNMFPEVIPDYLDFPYQGILSRYTRNEVRFAAMYRCLQLFLSPEGTVDMTDPIGLFLLFGPSCVDPSLVPGSEIEEELD